MARSHALIKTAVWNTDSDFRQLPLDAQWGYEMLLSQPQITNCGVLLYRPDRWCRLAADLTYIRLLEAFAELRRHLFIVVDEGSGELLVRTFIKHDRVWRQPNLVKNARSEFGTIESGLIRQVLAHHYPWLTNGADPKDVDQLEGVIPLDDTLLKVLRKGVSEGLQEPLWEPLSETPSGRGSGTPPRARDADDPAPSPTTERVPQKDSLSETRGENEGTPATSGVAPTPAHVANNGTKSLQRARTLVSRVGAEYPSWPVLRDELLASSSVTGHPHYPGLTADDLVELADLHANLLDPEPDAT